MLQFLYGVILWIIVPCIMFGMLIFSMVICGQADEKRSAWAGFFLGLMVFTLYVISKLSLFQTMNFTFHSLPDLDFGSWMILLGGAVLGFFLLAIVVLLKPTRGIGVITLTLTSTSICALFSYIFMANIRDAAMFFALGILCGLLVHVMFLPETLPKVFD